MNFVTVTANGVKNAVIRKLSTFVDDTPIYRELILQDFAKPCFFVLTESVNVSYEMQPYQNQLHTVQVLYFANQRVTTAFEECCRIAAFLVETLESVELEFTRDGETVATLPIKASSVNYNTQDGMLTFTVTYKIRCRKEKPDTAKLRKLFQDTQIKEG